MKNILSILFFAILTYSLGASASLILTLEGKVYSLTSENVILQVEDQLYSIKKSDLDETDLKQTEQANNVVTFQVPLEAITKIAPLARK